MILKKESKNLGIINKEPRVVTGFCQLFVIAMNDLMLKILIISAIISIIISMSFANDSERPIAWVEGGAILVAVLVVTTVTAWNDYQKEKQFLKLSAYNDSQNNLISMRKGVEMEINFDEINTGDIIQIKPGMNIPWDAILVQGTGVTTDESAMTGESIELK